MALDGGGASRGRRSLLEVARIYASAGLCALPAVRHGEEKRVALPAWKPYQQRLPTSEETEAWFGAQRASGNAVCLVCGAVSGHLEMIDFDLAGEAYEPWLEEVDDAVPGLVERLVVESTPSGGRHVVYRCAEPVGGNMKLAQRRITCDGPEPIVVGGKTQTPRRDVSGAWSVVVTMIETRGEGGLFLCAPSEGYELIGGELHDPPLLSGEERDVVLACALGLNEVPPPVVDGPRSAGPRPNGELRPGDDFNARGDPREILAEHGWTLVRPGENEHWRRPGKPAGTSATLKDRVFFVFSTNAAPFEAQRGYSPFAVYALLKHGGDFGTAASALGARGFRSPPTAREGNGCAATTGAQTEPTAEEPVAVELVLVEDLVAAHPQLRPPVIHGLLRQGETMNVIAPPKTGKSWLTLDLAIAVATGRSWLGSFLTEPGEVLIIDNELHRETIAHRVPRVAEARGVEMRRIGRRIAVDSMRGRLRSIFELGPYFEALEPGRFKVVVLDAFYRFMPVGEDENDNGTMANIYSKIDAFADRLGCCFVLIHHSTKGSQTGKAITDVGAGAGAQSRATDTHLVLRHHEEQGVVVLDAAARSWAPINPLCLRWSFPVWDVDESLDPSALKSPRAKKEKSKPAAPQPDPWDVHRFVEAFISEEPATKAQIREAAKDEPGLSWRRVADLLEVAEAQDLIRRQRLRGRGGPTGFFLTTSSLGANGVATDA